MAYSRHGGWPRLVRRDRQPFEVTGQSLHVCPPINIGGQWVKEPRNHAVRLIGARKVTPMLESGLPQIANRLRVVLADIGEQQAKSFFLRRIDPAFGQLLRDASPAEIRVDDQVSDFRNVSFSFLDGGDPDHRVSLVERDDNNTCALEPFSIQLLRQLSTRVDEVSGLLTLGWVGAGAIVKAHDGIQSSVAFRRWATTNQVNDG